MRLQFQNNLIVTGNGSKKKLRGNNCGLQFRKQLRVAVAQRFSMREKKSGLEWRAFSLAHKALVRNKIIASGGRVRA
jgi:hypothetical protein